MKKNFCNQKEVFPFVPSKYTMEVVQDLLNNMARLDFDI